MTGYAATKYSEASSTGTITSWSEGTIPTGFLECNGQAVSRTTYAQLFSVIGVTYGPGDGSATFNLPNLSDNVAVGKSNNKALASTGGSNTVSGNISNKSLSTAQLAAHSHEYGYTTGAVPHGLGMNLNGSNSRQSTTTTGSGSAHNHNFTSGTDAALQPYLTLIYIIKD